MKLVRPLLALALVSSLSVVNAHAIGKREQGALMGAGVLLLLPTLSQNMGNLFGAQNTQPVVVHREPVVHKEVVYVEKAPPKRRYYDNRRYYDEDEPYRRKTIIIER